MYNFKILFMTSLFLPSSSGRAPLISPYTIASRLAYIVGITSSYTGAKVHALDCFVGYCICICIWGKNFSCWWECLLYCRSLYKYIWIRVGSDKKNL